MREYLAISLLLICETHAIAAVGSVSVVRLEADELEITFVSASVTDVAMAQDSLIPIAIEYCNGKTPIFGKYSFESTEQVGGETDGVSSFELIQYISCMDSEPSVNDAKHVKSDVHVDRATVESEIRGLTESYYASYFSGDITEAYSYFSETMKSFSDFEDWKSRAEEARANVGDIVLINVHTVTIYEDPPNAPDTGIYVAADYENRFANVPYHCGYLVWFLGTSGTFEIIREETGFVTKDNIEAASDTDRRYLLQQMRCRAR